jgi:Tol biopolymer transport system component
MGAMIAFQANNGVYTVNADGARVTQIAAAGGLAGEPAWSPDGTKLLYSKSSLNPDAVDITQLWTINVNGSDNRRIYQGLSPGVAGRCRSGHPTASRSQLRRTGASSL